jgi:hypothetical protein
MVAAQFYFIECLLLFNFMILFQLAEKEDNEYCEDCIVVTIYYNSTVIIDIYFMRRMGNGK